MVNKFWTVQDGVIGTAHINREGKQVDFRPSNYYHFDGKVFSVRPPKGQVEEIYKEDLNLQGGWLGLLASFPWKIASTGIGTGKFPTLVITSILVNVNGQEALINLKLEDMYQEVSIGVETIESKALYEQLMAERQSVIDARIAKEQARKEAALLLGEEFESKLLSIFSTFKGQQKKWVYRFIGNSNKAANEVLTTLANIDMLGYQGWVELITGTRPYGIYGSVDRALVAERLKEVLGL